MRTPRITVPRLPKRRDPAVRFAGILKKGGTHCDSHKRERVDARKAIRDAEEEALFQKSMGDAP